jgi:glycosyltransferase involved in cell wall biosynthesis
LSQRECALPELALFCHVPGLSVVIITYNEENNIARCVDSVKDIADEILVLDSFSTDRTPAICRELGVRFEQHAFDGHIQQKNRAKNLATNKWVLSLDADEVPDAKLLENIKQLKEIEFGSMPGYRMNRLNFYCGKPIKTCGWYPDSKLRLWNKDAGEWRGVNPHDRFELFDDAKTGTISGDILHNTYPTHAHMVKQVNRFAEIAAEQNSQRPLLYLIFKLIFATPARFIRSYFIKQGIRDGRAGLLISYYQTLEVGKKYARAITLKIKGTAVKT